MGFGAVRAAAFLLERPAMGEGRDYDRYSREEREILFEGEEKRDKEREEMLERLAIASSFFYY